MTDSDEFSNSKASDRPERGNKVGAQSNLSSTDNIGLDVVPLKVPRPQKQADVSKTQKVSPYQVKGEEPYLTQYQERKQNQTIFNTMKPASKSYTKVQTLQQ